MKCTYNEKTIIRVGIKLQLLDIIIIIIMYHYVPLSNLVPVLKFIIIISA
jgi:hypothetical protein